MAAVDDVRPTRERLLDEALASFARRGYEATSLDALAATLGVRKQTILYYHPSKEALLEAVIGRAVDDLAAATAGRSGPRDVVDAVLRLGAERPELLELVREVVRLGPPSTTRMRAGLAPLLDRAGGAVPGDRLAVAAAMVVGLATEVEVLRAAGVEPDLAWLRRRRRAVLAELD